MVRTLLPAVFASLLLAATLPAPAAAADQGTLSVDLPARGVGDRYRVHVEEEVRFPWGGEIVTFEDEETQIHTLSVRELPLSWGDRRQVLYVNVSLPAEDPFPSFRTPHAYALSTGEAVAAPVGWPIVGVATSVLSVAGSLELRARLKYTIGPTEIVHEPTTRLQEIVGDRTLTTETNFTRVVDHRPRFDLVQRFHLNATGTDTVDGTPTLRVRLTTERLEDGTWTEAGIPVTLWLADGKPVPLRVRSQVEEPPFRYELTQNVTVLERGDEPVPWGQGDPPRLEGPANPYEKGPVTADGPPDGDAADHPFPLSEAVTWAKLLPTADAFQRFLLKHPDAVLVRAAFQTVEGAPEGARHVWHLQYADEEASQGVRVTRHVPREPASSATFHTSEDWFTFPTTFPADRVDGQQVLTVGQMADLQDRYALEDETDRLLAFDLDVDEGELGLDLVLQSANVSRSGTPYLEERGRTEARATILDGRTGEAEYHVFYEAWYRREARLDPPEAPAAGEAVPRWVPPIR